MRNKTFSLRGLCGISGGATSLASPQVASRMSQVFHAPTFAASLGLGVGRGGVAAKTCAAIGRSERRVIIAPCFARIANRTDTSPVRLARASPGIDSDAAPRFPASRNPMTAQVLPRVEARHRNRVEKASSIGAVRLSSGGFFAGTHRGPSRARLL